MKNGTEETKFEGGEKVCKYDEPQKIGRITVHNYTNQGITYYLVEWLISPDGCYREYVMGREMQLTSAPLFTKGTKVHIPKVSAKCVGHITGKIGYGAFGKLMYEICLNTMPSKKVQPWNYRWEYEEELQVYYY